jgi:hypothetical protein
VNIAPPYVRTLVRNVGCFMPMITYLVRLCLVPTSTSAEIFPDLLFHCMMRRMRCSD